MGNSTPADFRRDELGRHRQIRFGRMLAMGFGTTLRELWSGTPLAVDVHPALDPGQQWVVGLSAPLVQMSLSGIHSRLYPTRHILSERLVRALLRDVWEVRSREDLLVVVGSLSLGASMRDLARDTPAMAEVAMAWDLARGAHETRQGFAAGYLSAEEAWTTLERIGEVAAACYASWSAYGEDFLRGRGVWFEAAGSPRRFSSMDEARRAVLTLLDPGNRESPWNLSPWPQA